MQYLSLYLHIPFCIKKCAYCDFLSAPESRENIECYVQRLCEEISKQAPFYKERVVDTVFIGGGTPSILTCSQIELILKRLRNEFFLAREIEFTIESNPGTLNKEILECYRQGGINRISIGLQSTNDEELKLLGRIHTYQEFLDNYQAARQVGFDNINVDLMSGLPNQTEDSYCNNLKKIIALQPEHISAYGLIIEENTPFYERYQGKTGQQELPTEDEERNMYYAGRELLEQAGYHQYEISNYAKQAFECRHNIGYWTGKEYLGLGLGASSMISNTRWKNTSDFQQYLTEKDIHREEVIPLSYKDRMEEFMFLGLRMTKGISREVFEQTFQTGLDEVYGRWLERMKEEELITGIEQIALTKRGMDLANYVMTGFLF